MDVKLDLILREEHTYTEGVREYVAEEGVWV